MPSEVKALKHLDHILLIVRIESLDSLKQVHFYLALLVEPLLVPNNFKSANLLSLMI